MRATQKRACLTAALFCGYLFLCYAFQSDRPAYLHPPEAQAPSEQTEAHPAPERHCTAAAVNRNTDPNHTRAHLDFWRSLDNATVDAYQKDWQSFVRNGVQEKPALHGRGVVLVAGNSDTFGRALTAVKMLRHYGCRLPVEVWHLRDEAPSNLTVDALHVLDTTLHDLSEPQLPRPVQHRRDADKQFQIKAAAIINSHFRELLYLDSDNIPTRDPSFLFKSSTFLATGALFFPDFWKTHTENRIYDILDVPCNDEWEQESGQMVIDKTRGWLPLQLAWYMQDRNDRYFQFLNGDKDTFRFAWKALGVPYHMTETFLGMAGIELERFCGHTMLQYADDDGLPLFAHANLMKIFDKSDFMALQPDEEVFRERPWHLIKRYTHSKEETNLTPSFYVSARGQPCMDYLWEEGQPDVQVDGFDNVLGDFQDTYFRNGGIGGERREHP